MTVSVGGGRGLVAIARSFYTIAKMSRVQETITFRFKTNLDV